MAVQHAGAAGIGVVGLQEVRGSLAKLGTEWPAQLRRLNKTVADIVAQEARSLAPERTGALRRSITSRAEQKSASVKGGGARVPYFGFIDFGNRVHGGHGVGRSDSQPRPFIKSGRIIYPALEAKRTAVLEAYEEGMAHLIDGAGLNSVSAVAQRVLGSIK